MIKKGSRRITHGLGLIAVILATVLPVAVSFAQTQFNGTYAGSWSKTCPACGITTSAGTFTTTLANGVISNAQVILTSGDSGPRFDSGTVSSSGAITASGATPSQCSSSVTTFTGQITITPSGGAGMTMTFSRPASGICAAEFGTITAARTTTPSVVADNEIPAAFTLLQSYPNPFNPTSTIQYHVAVSAFVKLSVYDILGREITLLVNENNSVGNHRVTFDANGLPGGIYFYRLEANAISSGQAGSFIETKKLLLIR